MTINNTNEMQKGLTFLELIQELNIQIPIIQRDYAQGRLDDKATEIRDGFLTAIIDALSGVNQKPLILDFVFGSVQLTNVFIPLDGQQRLTTLFLLHWYLSADEKLAIFRSNVDQSTFSRFTYETRISSKDFCNCLVVHAYSTIKTCFEDQIAIFETQIDELGEQIKNSDSKIEGLNKKVLFLRKTAEKRWTELELEKEEAIREKLMSQIKKMRYSKEKWSLSSTIKNQPWFMWAWRKDPTVKGMLVMLDELNQRLYKLDTTDRTSMWQALENGKIIFHLLPLEKFALTNELYVKMNARGKELSKFDIIKSTLEEQMQLNNVDIKVQNKWRRNIDSTWVDLFWNNLVKSKLTKTTSEEELKKHVDSVENSYLRFIKRMIVYHLFTDDDCFDCNWNDINIKRYVPFEYEGNNIINQLREFSVRNDVLKLLPLFCRTKFFRSAFFEFIITSFESLIFIESNDEKYDGSELIDGIYFEVSPKTIFEAFNSENITYDTRVQFFALLHFFKYNIAKVVSQSDDLKIEFNNWMRIIRNLSTNTNTNFYDTYNDFQRSLKSIERWSIDIYRDKKCISIIEYFLDKETKEGFNAEQLKEETVKAALIKDLTHGIQWEKSLRDAEEYKYFLGQIRFLLEWSKERDTDKFSLDKFNEYNDKIRSVFCKDGLKDEMQNDNIFRNALIATYPYYLINDSFIYNTGKDRDWSWKRYLRETDKSLNIKNLLDKWDKEQQHSFEEFCSNYTEKNKPSDWRKYFIERPEIYDELYHNKISWWNRDNEEICLLSKTRWSSKHKELRTFYWHLTHALNGDVYLNSTDDANPFSAVFYRNNNEIYSIKFIPNWDDGWQMGTYVISMNIQPESPIYSFNTANDLWESSFQSDKIHIIETELERLFSNQKFS